MFKAAAFSRLSELNEAEVRLYFIDPIISRLGYDDNPALYLRLEEQLEYPYYHIGRPSKKDMPLGRMDYRAGLANRRGSFVVEAKAASQEIGQKEVEQAHSYAAHAKVSANYFVLCNGRRLVIYETLSGAQADPLVDLDIGDINDEFYKIENILSPERLAARCSVKYDTKLRLCEGFSSSERITGGEYSMLNWSIKAFAGGADITDTLKKYDPNFSKIDEMALLFQREHTARIRGGKVSRRDDGTLVASVGFFGISKGNEIGMQRLGIDKIDLIARDKFLSTDLNNPTMFESLTLINPAPGTTIPDPQDSRIEVPVMGPGSLHVVCGIAKDNKAILGGYKAIAELHITPLGITVLLEMDGRVSLTVDPDGHWPV